MDNNEDEDVTIGDMVGKLSDDGDSAVVATDPDATGCSYGLCLKLATKIIFFFKVGFLFHACIIAQTGNINNQIRILLADQPRYFPGLLGHFPGFSVTSRDL